MSDPDRRKKYFTKHLFRAGLQCPVKLYYYAHDYLQDERIRPFLEHAGYNKHQLKALMRSHYPNGRLVKESNFESAHKATRSFLEAEGVVFDAVFVHERKVAKIPLIIKNDGQVEACFIQMKVINPHKHRLTDHTGRLHKKWEQYIYDAAYQLHIVLQLYPQWEINPFLLLPDKTGAARQDDLNRLIDDPEVTFNEPDLFHKIDISEHVDKVLRSKEAMLLPEDRSFAETVHRLETLYFKGERAPVEVGRKCKTCEFRIPDQRVCEGYESGFNECWNHCVGAPRFSESEPHVFDLIGPGVNRWMDKNTYLQKNILLANLPTLKSVLHSRNAITHKQRQMLQVRKAKKKEVPREIVKMPLFEEVDRWEYPVHFMDFEAGNYAVPIRKDRHPYHLVLFQFSCHTLHENGALSHAEWIAQEQQPYPNFELVRKLMQVPDIGEGTIIQYSNFERTALKTIRNELQSESNEITDAPILIDWLNSVIQRHDSSHPAGPFLADLSRLVKQYYYNRYMADSLSIKDVVQSVMTLSEPLKKRFIQPYKSSNFNNMKWWQWDAEKEEAANPYHLLRSMQSGIKVGRGTEAMVTFGNILNGSLTGERKERALQALLQYCELDTLAMVMIFEHWNSLQRTD